MKKLSRVQSAEFEDHAEEIEECGKKLHEAIEAFNAA